MINSRVFTVKFFDLNSKCLLYLKNNSSPSCSILARSRSHGSRVINAAHHRQSSHAIQYKIYRNIQRLHTSGIVRQTRTALIEGDAQRLYSDVAVEVRGSDEAVLDSYCQFVSRAATVLNFDISGKIILPTHLEKHTLLKSPHIYKKHMAQYEIRTYKRMLQLKHLTGQSADTFLEYIQRNIPEGVSMIVEQTELHPLPEFIKRAQANA